VSPAFILSEIKTGSLVHFWSALDHGAFLALTEPKKSTVAAFAGIAIAINKSEQIKRVIFTFFIFLAHKGQSYFNL